MESGQGADRNRPYSSGWPSFQSTNLPQPHPGNMAQPNMIPPPMGPPFAQMPPQAPVAEFYPADTGEASARSTVASTHAIRDAYVSVIFGDYGFACANGVERNLWKFGFYKHIEEFRRRIRKLASKPRSNAPDVPEGNAELGRLIRCFQGFLSESAGFYHNLCFRLQVHFNMRLPGLVSFDQFGIPTENPDRDPSEPPPLGLHSVHRCLIYLGDLARYREMHTESPRKDFSLSRQHYYQALMLLPNNGNPHNQLAVLAAYCGDDTSATYYYLRSLVLSEPFLTARENLATLFDKNKERLNEGQPKTHLKGPGSAGAEKNTRVNGFLWRYLRILEIVCTDETADDLSVLIGLCLDSLPGLLQSRQLNDTMILRLTTMNMVMLHRCFEGWSIPEPAGSGPISGRVSSSTQRHILSFCLRFFASLLAVAANTTDAILTKQKNPKTRPPAPQKTFSPPYIGSIKVFCDWLRTHLSVWNNNDATAVMFTSLLGSNLATLLNQWPKVLGMATASIPQDSTQWNTTSTLPEDFELWGFTPLLKSQSHTPLSLAHPNISPEETCSQRANYLLSFGRWLSNVTLVFNTASYVLLCTAQKGNRCPTFSGPPGTAASMGIAAAIPSETAENDSPSEEEDATNEGDNNVDETNEVDTVEDDRKEGEPCQEDGQWDDESIVYAVTGEPSHYGPTPNPTDPTANSSSSPLVNQETPLSPHISNAFPGPLNFVTPTFAMSFQPRSDPPNSIPDPSASLSASIINAVIGNDSGASLTDRQSNFDFGQDGDEISSMSPPTSARMVSASASGAFDPSLWGPPLSATPSFLNSSTPKHNHDGTSLAAFAFGPTQTQDSIPGQDAVLGTNLSRVSSLRSQALHSDEPSAGGADANPSNFQSYPSQGPPLHVPPPWHRPPFSPYAQAFSPAQSPMFMSGPESAMFSQTPTQVPPGFSIWGNGAPPFSPGNPPTSPHVSGPPGFGVMGPGGPDYVSPSQTFYAPTNFGPSPLGMSPFNQSPAPPGVHLPGATGRTTAQGNETNRGEG